MNAVKRCLALFAATLVVGACSGDPTADDAGTGLTIRTTPSVVWMREDQTLELDVEAVDALGGTQPGSWTATVAGPFTAVLDPDYQETSTGGVNQIRRFIITPTAAGEGTVTFAGTGGNVTIPVRISPSPTAFAVTISNENPVLAEQITVTAPAGVRFTASTAVSFVAGGLDATNNGLAAPSITAFNADSTQITVLPAPGAAGRMRFTGVANVSTPTLTTTVTTAGTDSVTVPALTSVTTVFSSATPTANGGLTVTMPANFKFRPTSAFSMTGQALPVIVVSRSADSNSVVLMPAPGATGQISITNVQFAPLASLALTLPTTGSVTVGAAPSLGPDDMGDVANPTFAAPTVVGNTTGWYDVMTFTMPDPSPLCDGGARAQHYTLTVAATGSYTITANWVTGSDMDLGTMVKDGSYSSATCSDYLTTAGLSTAKPEANTVNLTAGTDYVITVIDYVASGTLGTGYLQLQVRRN